MVPEQCFFWLIGSAVILHDHITSGLVMHDSCEVNRSSVYEVMPPPIVNIILNLQRLRRLARTTPNPCFCVEFSMRSVSVYGMYQTNKKGDTMVLNDDFKSAAERVTQLPKRPPNDILLQLYALFKQSTVGDVTGDRPGFADFEGRAKFDAWNKLQRKSADEAKQEYISLVEKLEQDAAG